MSVENLKEYARRCAAEPELRATARTIGMTDAEGHMRHAESLGLDWTTADLVAFRKEVIDDEEDLVDLTEEELERVAGGIAAVTVAVAVGVGAAVGGSAAAAVTGVAVGGAVAAGGDGGW